MRNRIRLWGVVAALFVAALLIACRREPTIVEKQPGAVSEKTVVADPTNLSGKTVDHVIPLVAPVAKRCEVGTQLDPSGAVAAKATSMRRDVPMYLTIWLSESPEDLQVSMRVRDTDGEEVANVVKPAKGAKVITLKLDQRLDPGTYRIEGVWGGNVACEQELEIRD